MAATTTSRDAYALKTVPDPAADRSDAARSKISPDRPGTKASAHTACSSARRRRCGAIGQSKALTSAGGDPLPDALDKTADSDRTASGPNL